MPLKNHVGKSRQGYLRRADEPSDNRRIGWQQHNQRDNNDHNADVD